MPPLTVKKLPDLGRRRTLTMAAAKGGIGKTTTNAHVAYPLAQFGMRVLLIDLDANAGLSSVLGAWDRGPGVVEFLDSTEVPKEDCIRRPEGWQPSTDVPFADGGALIPGGCVDIVPANSGVAESVGRQDVRSVKRLRRALNDDNFAVDRYDLVMIDIPGADTAVVDLAMQASEHLVLTLLPESQGLRGFSRTVMRATVANEEDGLAFNVIGAVTSRYEKNRREHRDVMRVTRKFLSEQLGPDTLWLGLPVPSRASVSDANRAQRPIATRSAWKDNISNRTRSMDAVAAYSAIAIAIIRDVHGDEIANRIVEAFVAEDLGEYPTKLLLSGVGVTRAPHQDDDYPEED